MVSRILSPKIDRGPGSSLRSSGAPRRRERQGGFTLIEVMAAFVIFALLFGVVLQILTTSMSNTRLSGDYTRAALWAQSKLDVLGLEEMIEPGMTQGQFDDRFSWQMDVSEGFVFDDRGLDPEALPIALYHVKLTIEWGEHRRREAVFETLRSVDIHWEERQRGMR